MVTAHDAAYCHWYTSDMKVSSPFPPPFVRTYTGERDAFNQLYSAVFNATGT